MTRGSHARRCGLLGRGYEVAFVVLTTAAGCGPSDAVPARSASSVPGIVGGAAAPVPAAATTQPSAPGTPVATPTPTTLATAGASAPAPATQPPTGFVGWCDAQAVFNASCSQCHGETPLYGAPMSLTSLAELRAPSKSDPSQTVYQRVSQRIHDSQKPMPPTGFTLSAAGQSTLDAWIAAGAPQGSSEACAAPAPPATGIATAPTATPAAASTPAATSGSTAPAEGSADDWPADCGEHYKFVSNSNGQKSSVPPGEPPYYNMTIPAPWGAATAQALKFKPIIDNAKVIHHYILYAADGSFVNGWAPGDQGGTLPAGVGLQMPGGNYRLEVHYNNQTGTTQMDGSGVELCVAKTPRPNTAAVHWLGSLLILVPARGRQDVTSTCVPSVSAGPVHLISVSPHMHKTGVHAKMVINRANGETVVVHDAAFDFNDQRKYDVPDVLVNAGDTITTTCTFENDTNSLITFGQNTEDEMCFFFTTAWPIGQLVNGSRSPDGGSTHSCM